MNYAVESGSIARSTYNDDSYDISDMADLLQETPEDLELNEDVSAPATTLACEEPGTIGGTRVSYGIADILFPMTPPKPKGARLVRGPLRFN